MLVRNLTTGVWVMGLLAGVNLLGGCGSASAPDPILDVTCDDLGGTISADTTIAAGCYTVTSSITVQNAALTVEAGVTLRFEQSTFLLIGDNASMSAVGTAMDPILMTGMEATRGFWRGVEFRRSNSSRNNLEYVTIEYAGGGQNGNLFVDGTSSTSSRVSISNSRLENSENFGFYFDRDAVIERFSDNVVTANQTGAGSVFAKIAGSLDDVSTYVGNDNDRVEIQGDTVDSDQTWPAIDVGYQVSGNVMVGAALSIAAGAELAFESSLNMTVQDDGSLSAVGTADDPILLTATDPTPGFWAGLRFVRSNSSNNRLEHVTIEYAGGAYAGNLFLDGSSTAPSRLAADQCTFRDSAQFGFYFDNDVIVPEFSNITATANNDGAGSVVADAVSAVEGSGSYTGNSVDFVEIRGGTVETDQTLDAIDVDFFVTNSVMVTAQLTLSPGATLVFDSSTGMTVQDTGSLIAAGTMSDPILLTGAERTPGYWDGLRFVRSFSQANTLQFVTLEYGGGAYQGGLFVDGSSSARSLIDVANSTFTNSATYGIYLDTDATYNDDIESANTFSGNASGTVRIP